mmetsp:Transcript_2040/g.6171  ORF Transcript_2040/g.6171 Transcript_2040/m.6171 type:complete len:207 (+) Transcript_2040:57-677(+)
MDTLKMTRPNGEAVDVDLTDVKTLSQLRDRLGVSLGQSPACIRLLAGEQVITGGSDTHLGPDTFPEGVATVVVSKQVLESGFYHLDDCAAFNYDSDVDGGEDEIEILEDGTAKREVLHRRSWIDGGGNSGDDVVHSTGEGTWELADQTLKVDWSQPARHKGSQPGSPGKEFSLLEDGSLMYPCSFRKRYYKYSSTRKMHNARPGLR